MSVSDKPSSPPPPGGSARLIRRIALGTGLAFLLVIVVTAGGVAWVVTGGADVWLASILAGKLGVPDHPATVEGLTGGIPFHPRLAKLVMTDPQGGYVTVRNLAIDIEPAALWHRTLKITRLHADEINVERLPKSQAPASAPGAATTPPKVPALPVALDLDSLGIDRLILGQSVLGQPVQLAVAGHATLQAAVVDLHVTGSGINGTAADLLLNAAGRSDQAGLHVKADAAGHLAAVLPDKFKTTLGAEPRLNLALLLPDSGVLGIDGVTLNLAGMTLWAGGKYDQANGDMDVSLSASGDIQPFSGLVNQPVAGAVRLGGHIGGSVARPRANLTLASSGLGYQTNGIKTLDVKVDLSSPAADRLHILGSGILAGITQNGNPLPAGLGDSIALKLDAAADRSFAAIDLTSAQIQATGLDIAAKGRIAKSALQAEATLDADDLSRYSDLAKMKLSGKAALRLVAEQNAGGALSAKLTGRLGGLKSGVAAADALLGEAIDIAAEAGRGSDGKLTLSRATIKSRSLNVEAAGSLDPNTKAVQAQTKATIADMAALRGMLGPGYAGRLDVNAAIAGTTGAPSIKAELAADKIMVSGRPIDHLHALVDVPSLEARQGSITADLVASRISAALRAKVAQPAIGKIAITDLSLSGPATRASGALTIDTTRKRANGSLSAEIADLGAWSSLLGPAGGRFSLDAELSDARTQRIQIQAQAANLFMGNGPARQIVKRLALISDLSGPDLTQAAKFTGTFDLNAGGIQAGSAEIDTVHLGAMSRTAGKFDVQLAAQGFASGQGARRPFNIGANGTIGLDPKGQSVHLARLNAAYGPLTLRQTSPLDVTKYGEDIHLRGLAMAVGTGTLAGRADLDRSGVNLAVKGNALPIGQLAKLAGQHGVSGALGFDLAINGPRAGYAGRLALNIPDLKLDAEAQPNLPPLATMLTATLGPGRVVLNGTVSNGSGRKITLDGTVPITMPSLPAPPALDRNGPLSIHLVGNGRFEQWAEFLPIGEDRLTGGFAINAAVSGSVAAPKAGGQILISDGTYENAASGMKVAALTLNATGTQQGFEIRKLSATDSGSGSFSGRGKVDLSSTGAGIDLGLALKNFTVARGDEATVVASGTATVTGKPAAPKLVSSITINRAEINIPDKLPASVVTLNVVRVDSSKPVPAAPDAPPAAPAFAVALDVKVSAPGQVFVRGNGLDSEWKADFDISGTSAAPSIVGQLQSTRGTYSILGKDFTLSRGNIGFYGGSQIDPALDIIADTSANDITAEITIGGTASKPTLALSSVPALPQDEVLSRVMFGKGVGQISPAEGLSLAQAAASLAGVGGGGPGVLDKLRKVTGLDRLSLGSSGSSDTNGQSTSQTSSSQGGSALSSTSLSGGKYVAPGVFVGATQGASVGSTSAKVEIEITPHISVDATAGTTSTSQSIGAHYNLDY